MVITDAMHPQQPMIHTGSITAFFPKRNFLLHTDRREKERSRKNNKYFLLTNKDNFV